MMVDVLFLQQWHLSLVFFLQQNSPGFYFMFCSLSLLVFLFAGTILQLLCVNASPAKVSPLQTNLPVPSCVPDVPKPHVLPSAAATHGEVFDCTASPSSTTGPGCVCSQLEG